MSRRLRILLLVTTILCLLAPPASATAPRLTGTVSYEATRHEWRDMPQGNPRGDFRYFDETTSVHGTIEVSLIKVNTPSGARWVDDGTSVLAAATIDGSKIIKNNFGDGIVTCTQTHHNSASGLNWQSMVDELLARPGPHPGVFPLQLAQFGPGGGMAYNPPVLGSQVHLNVSGAVFPYGTGTASQVSDGEYPGCDPIQPASSAPFGAGGTLIGGTSGHIVNDLAAPVPEVVFDLNDDFHQRNTEGCTPDQCPNVDYTAVTTGTLNSVNGPPSVDAGPEVLGNVGEAVALSGSVSDDGLPFPAQVTTQWSTTSQPDGGVVTFGNASSATTTATFSKPGHYELVLTANDGQRSASSRTAADISAGDVNVTLTQTGGPAGPGAVIAGDTVAYDLVAHNAGTSTATAVSLTDRLPVGAAPATVTTTAGTCAGFATVTCTLGDLSAGASVTIRLRWRAPLAASGTTMLHHAELTTTSTDTNPADNVVDGTVGVTLPTLQIKIFESANTFNAFPDTCRRLPSIFIGEGAKLTIEIRFPFPLTAQEKSQVQWDVSNSATTPALGTLAGQPNVARIAVTAAAPSPLFDGGGVTVSFNGRPLPTAANDPSLPSTIRVITNGERARSLAALTAAANASAFAGTLPLATDLLSRFLALPTRTAAGAPTIGSKSVDICDKSLTHRAGANWGTSRTTAIPLLTYTANQPASRIVAQGVAEFVLNQKENIAAIQAYFASHRGVTQHTFARFAWSGNVSLGYSADVYAAVHGAEFIGSVVPTVVRDGPGLTTARVEVRGPVVDLYDYDLTAAQPAPPAAKVQISSVGQRAGKIFWDEFQLNNVVTITWSIQAR